jgi:hypothetical protein
MIAISSGRMSCCSARLRSIASGLPSEGRKGWISWLWMMTGIIEGSLTYTLALTAKRQGEHQFFKALRLLAKPISILARVAVSGTVPRVAKSKLKPPLPSGVRL